jgi:hypothetical protein
MQKNKIGKMQYGRETGMTREREEKKRVIVG